jgi:diamine N-acetyltransferase
MEVVIRNADIKDAALIADLSRETFYETFAAHNTEQDMRLFMEKQFTRDALMQEVGREGNLFFIAYQGAEAAGYVRMRVDHAHEELPDAIEIARIYTLKKWIGQGIGKELMKHCLAVTAGMGKRTIWLGVWEKNQRAIDFYMKWGFRKFGEHDFLLGTDLQTDWLMKKEL